VKQDIDTQEDQEKRLAFDLRAIYAVEIVGMSLKEALIYRKAKDFARWFKALEDIKTVTKHTWEDKTNSLKTYNDYVSNISNLILSSKMHEAIFSGGQKINTRDASIIANQIEKVLRELEEFLYEKIEKLFGARGQDEESEWE